jgi:hypothetical protein
MMYNSQIRRLHSFHRPPAQAVEACARLSESGASQCPCLPAAAEGTSHDVMPAYGTKRTCQGRLTMSAPVGKTDVPRGPGHFRF